MSETRALTPAQERLATISPGTPLSPRTERAIHIVTKKLHKVMQKTLQTDVEFQDKVRAYVVKTHGDGTFYENRLHFDKDDGFWAMVELSRQCSCCGQMLISYGGNGKLLSCGGCKLVHYCDRKCQKRDWKEAHKLVCCPPKAKDGMEFVMHLCIRALTIIRFFVEVQDEMGGLKKVMSQNVMSSILLQRSDSRSQTYIDLAKEEWVTGGRFDRVCNHFREKQESNRILYPIWETTTDNVSFVPISLDFMSNGLGIPDALVTCFKKRISANEDTFFVLVSNTMNGKVAVVGGNSFILTPCAAQKLCQESEVAK